jgi:gamma-glutamylcyclotransferase (GGCT)/AIG2-like uncharacterized protein YtfP
MQTDLVFTYGMLVDPQVMGIENFYSLASLSGYILEFRKFLNVVPISGARVEGVVWSVDSSLMSLLDKYEGYPSLYDRKIVKVHCKDRSGAKNAWVYTMTPGTRSRLSKSPLPSTSYLEQVDSAYHIMNLDTKQLIIAYKSIGKNK